MPIIMTTDPIVPAIIPDSEVAVREWSKRLGFSLELHLDVVDGVFVPFSSWPYNPSGDPSDARSVTDRFTLEVDLMVHEPLPAAAKWIAAGADMLVFHVETIPPDIFRTFAESAKVTVGVSALLDTPETVLEAYIPYADYVQVMGIAQIGAQGQPFDQRALERVARLRAAYPDLTISIDGAVSERSIVALKEAGATRFIVGSAITRAPDPAAAHYALSRQLEAKA
jgi:ribulose-phosphate 3-epimerase